MNRSTLAIVIAIMVCTLATIVHQQDIHTARLAAESRVLDRDAELATIQFCISYTRVHGVPCPLSK